MLFLAVAFGSAAQNAGLQQIKQGAVLRLMSGFTNTSTGFSGTAEYKWEFGNGNTSVLINAGTTYREEKTYTVKLTVTDAGKNVTKSMDIMVYKKPQVNFEADIVKGCLPLAVTFSANSSAGDGSISSYFWDFWRWCHPIRQPANSAHLQHCPNSNSRINGNK